MNVAQLLPLFPLAILCGSAVAAPPVTNTQADTVTRTNRLAQESSPYLLLHAHNPVDWYPWGPEAMEKARAENRPIFLSVGYSSCYWCHVMERQVFSNERIAEFMNAHFVNIKVDREERPDIDDIYMTSLIVYQQASGQGGGGGWPLSMFLTPDGNPIAGATYLPLEDSPDGRTGFLTVARRVSELWSTRQEALASSAEAIAAEVRRLSGPGIVATSIPLEPGLIEASIAAVKDMYDPEWGGVDFRRSRPNGPRFPSVPRLNLLFSIARQTSDAELMKIVEHSLTAMARGGIRDHLGGGFHRYSTDRRWHVPHFEKMLYDQAMLLKVYAQMAALTGRSDFTRVASGITQFLEREMTLPDGGFCSALDAETNAIEGAYYVWQPDEIRAALNGDEAELFLEAYGMTAPSPFEHGYVLYLPGDPQAFAERRELSADGLESRLADIRAKLLIVRQERPRPLLDDKVLTEWNALMIEALAVSGTLPGHEADLVTAARAADFLLTHLQDADGRLLRTWRNGKASAAAACLDDYAFFVAALLQLHATTRDERWLTEAERLTDQQIRDFYNAELSTFFFTAHDHEKLMARTSSVFDSVSESGISVTIRNLVTLSTLRDRSDLAEIAGNVLNRTSGVLKESPGACCGLALALNSWLSGQHQAGLAAARSEYQWTTSSGIEKQSTQRVDERADAEVDKTQTADDQIVFRPVFPDPAEPASIANRDEERPVKAKIYPMFDKLERGGKCPVAIELTISEPWHINANPSSPDFLVPTEIKLKSEQKIKMTKVKYPEHELLVVPGSDMPYHVYGRKVIIYALLETDAAEEIEKAELEIRIRYQACNDRECLPPEEIVMKGTLPLANPGDVIKRVNEDKFPKPKPASEPENAKPERPVR